MMDVGLEAALHAACGVLLRAQAWIAQRTAGRLGGGRGGGVDVSAPRSVVLTIWMNTIRLEFGASEFGTKRM
jgi:hypothetical protein